MWKENPAHPPQGLFDRADLAFYRKNSADLSTSLRALPRGIVPDGEQMQLKRG